MKISVVIPALNEEKLLPELFESLKNQTRKSDEIIVVNGGSTDRTVAVAEHFGARVITVPRITIGYSRQQGLLAATGDVVAFTDADVLLPRTGLQR